jgi:hypothetical protein
LDSQRNFLGLSVTETDSTIAVTDNDESSERETTSTLHNLRNAIDVNDS